MNSLRAISWESKNTKNINKREQHKRMRKPEYLENKLKNLELT
jgi:hypothetical protein